ncbi:RES domain-containing protein [Pedobacter sp. SD-b]|uniref:RES domain-containing protein n=1 Tax=Pedobacter segetis TaxID=2793069 RepID=A0ABS1BNV9_9SPHI|nr:RES domain-containing protein [Pedobacter segetis]MBK0384556.1 RES domain-containing protein [Pedobacter segetis]
MTSVPRHIIEDILTTVLRLKKENSPESYISIKNTFKLFSIPFPVITIPKGSVFYRVRVHTKDETNCLFKRVSDLGHRVDRNGIKKFGRANEPFQSIFYCSDVKETAFCETSKLVRNNENENFEENSLGTWRTRRDIKVACLPKNKDYYGNKTIESLNKDLNDCFNEFNNDDSYNLQYFLHRISDEFSLNSSDRDFNYLLTCAFANYVFETPMSPMNSDEKVDIDGITYPSVQWTSKGMNLALKPELIKNKEIELVRVNYRIMQLTSKKTYFETVNFASKSIDYNSEPWEIKWN